jgi:hypothetical protein
MPPAVSAAMPTAKSSQEPSDSHQRARAQRCALDAVQEALDRRDNGGDAATTTDN